MENSEKEKFIQTINSLYPTDSPFSDTNEIGWKLLRSAIERTGFNWRELPESVLRHWADSCMYEERSK